MNRREFVKMAGMSAAASVLAPAAGLAHNLKNRDFLYGALLHLGANMWSDEPVPRAEDPNPRYPYPDFLTPSELERAKFGHQQHGAADELRCDEEVWRTVTARMQELGMNFVMIDIGEGLVYPSHPELAVKGSWTPEKLADELQRLRKMGLEPIPKLNFSATHDTWMKDYHRMVSTKKYYEVVADVIKDVCEIFKPRYFHLGWDEEDYVHQDRHQFVVIRQGELWWHDFLYTVREVEKYGARPWIWSDMIWHHRDEFVDRCPKNVLQSNWYYLGDFDPPKDSPLYPMVHAYEWLDEAGFDQVPCSSSCGDWGTYTANPRMTVGYCKSRLAPERFKGLLSTSWKLMLKPFEQGILQSLDQTKPAMEILGTFM